MVHYVDATASAYSVAPNGAVAPVGTPAATASSPLSAAFSPDGGLLASANIGTTPGTGTVSMFAVAGNVLTPIGSGVLSGSGTGSVAFSPDGTRLAVANAWSDEVRLFSVLSGGALTPAPRPRQAT